MNMVRCVDHKGVEYPSQKAMAEAWGVIPCTLRDRLSRGEPLEMALSPRSHKMRIVRDHEGNEFPSVVALCRHWGISSTVYYNRTRAGWSLERVLTAPLKY